MLRYESYSLRRKNRLKPVLRVIVFLAVVAAIHALVTGVALISLEVDSASMEPTLSRGDRVLASPLAFGVKLPLLPESLRRYGAPHRGDLVVFEVPGYPPRSWISRVGEEIVRFVTLNRHSLLEGPDGRPVERLSLKRVIGLPGDTIRMEKLEAYIRPSGHAGFQREQEIVPGPYAVSTRPAKPWPEGLPFSGDMQQVTLGSDEYFVLGDNRAHSSDSRSWGVVPARDIRGRVLLRYWPVKRFGRP